MVSHYLLRHGKQLLLQSVLSLLKNSRLLQDLLLLFGFQHDLLLLGLAQKLLLLLKETDLLDAQRFLLVFKELLFFWLFFWFLLLKGGRLLSTLGVLFSVHVILLLLRHFTDRKSVV